jgi:hypothetical protein
MFSGASFCAAPFSSYVIIVLGNGEIFFFDGYVERTINFDLSIKY